jgi:hypothetical protein
MLVSADEVTGDEAEAGCRPVCRRAVQIGWAPPSGETQITLD